MSAKAFAIFLLSASVVMTVGSLFVFSVGWDKLKDALDLSAISGQIEYTNTAGLHPRPTLIMKEVDGHQSLTIPVASSGAFEQSEVPPGKYKLLFRGKGLATVEREVVVPKRTTLDVGRLSAQLSTTELFKQEWASGFRIATVADGPNDSLWAMGFKGNEYRIYKKQDQDWKEVVVPQFSGAIQVVAAKLLRNGSFLLGSIGNGAAISRDGGQTWLQVKTPPDVWGVRQILELPGNMLLLAGARGSRYLKDEGVVLRSSDGGKTWDEILRLSDSIAGMSYLSSGRTVLYTSSLKGTATIRFSDDLGATWTDAEIGGVSEPIRGFNFIQVLSNGKLLAGAEDGKNWKGSFFRGGLLLQSDDSGRTWVPLHVDSTWSSVKAALQAVDGRLYVWSDANVFVSSDSGKTWQTFAQTGSGYSDTLVVTKTAMFVISGEQLLKIQSDLDVKSLNAWLQ